MYPQDVLRYVGIGFLVLGAILAVLSVVVFVTRDVRNAVRFLRGETPNGAGDVGTSGQTKRVSAIHRSHNITRSTRESLAEAEASLSVRASGAWRMDGQRDKDVSQDELATVVSDTSQDRLATVVDDVSEDDVPTEVGVPEATDTLTVVEATDTVSYRNDSNSYEGDGPASARSYDSGNPQVRGESEADTRRPTNDPSFVVCKDVVIVHADVDLFVV